MDHDLPAAFTKIMTSVRVFHDWQAPVLKLVNCRVNMAGHIEQKVFANHSHQVDTGIAHVIFRIVLTPAGAHVAVNSVEALRYRT